MSVEKSLAVKLQQKTRWLDGYKFWRGQYALRNDEFIEIQNTAKKLSAEYVQMVRKHLDQETIELLGFGNPPKAPVINEKYIQTMFNLPKEVAGPIRKIADLDNYITKFFPSLLIPGRIQANHIISAIKESLFDDIIDRKNNKRESSIYKGVLYSDLSRNVFVVNKTKEENKKFLRLEIDCSDDIGNILKTVCTVVEAHKTKIGQEFYSCKEFVDIDLDLFLTKKRPGVAYNVGAKSDNSRAIGLWIYDYMADSGCTQSAAVDVFMSTPLLKAVGGNDSTSYRDALKRMHRQTKKCIDRAEVLKIQ